MKKILSITLSLVGALLLTATMTSCGEQSQLKQAIDKYNEKMPQDAGGGLTIKQLTLTDTQMVYECEQSEEVDSVKTMRANQDLFKNGVVQNLVKNVNNEAFKQIIETLVSTNRSLSYHITGLKTGETLDVEVSAGELSDILAGNAPTAEPTAEPEDSTATGVPAEGQ